MHELSFYERAFFRLRIATDTLSLQGEGRVRV